MQAKHIMDNDTSNISIEILRITVSDARRLVKHVLRQRCLCMPSAQTELPWGKHSNPCDYKSACKTPAQTNRGVTSTVKPKVGLPHICPGQRAGQSHLRWYYSSAVAQCSSFSTSYFSLPHATWRYHWYIWRRAYTGPTLVIRCHFLECI